jgi:hypothetical protein
LNQENNYQAPRASLELPELGRAPAAHGPLLLAAIGVQLLLIAFVIPDAIRFTEMGDISVLTLLGILLAGFFLVASELLITTRRLLGARATLTAAFLLSLLSAYPSHERSMYLCIIVSGYCALICTRTRQPVSRQRIEPT